MWFLIKGSVWFALVLVVLSYFSSRPVAETEAASQFQVQDAVGAAAQAYQYLSAICVEKPDVCIKGAETVSALGQRAKEGARVAFELLDQQFADEAPAIAELADPQPMPEKPQAADDISTGTIPAEAVPLPQKRPAHP
ncbi:hypothetical protein REJC140_02532 [Pseudorhizobium endolithicum]|uniref:DUF5330 domain-containing protein n=1 Tax=Pseudorhizobium endolithicum TaxID=1191678 RepID=A0ABN7JF13_9HYPH|nr:DUF5330 domain-containing protein [Pseudorhizobium endolithicum]CAD7027685.1 hypothetical protein REJC140_02532 [Pseudorhizobium endolithicum]